jgi:uncharacterized protein (UPF0261 family)
MQRILIVGTADTKAEELDLLRQAVREAGGEPFVVDVGVGEARCAVDADNAAVAACRPGGGGLPSQGDRGAAVSAMAEAFAGFVATVGEIGAILGIGGGGGTSIVTTGMRALPIGVPKVMVSTMASGDVSAYVDISDIVMMPAVTDLAGLNRISRAVLRKAAYAAVAMAQAAQGADATAETRPAIGLTMFGVTTPCVTQVVERLRDRFDCLVFHATGTGGRTMEKLADSGLLSGFIDATTTEVADHLFGGVLSAGPDRLGAAARTRLPYVGSVGALDMVNFQAPETVPARYAGRLFYRHNAQVTLMRTTPEENREAGRWIAGKLNQCEGPVRFLIPEKGVSMIDAPGQPFHDPQADAALFDAIEETLVQTERRRLLRLPLHINDDAFSQALVDHFLDIVG